MSESDTLNTPEDTEQQLDLWRTLRDTPELLERVAAEEGDPLRRQAALRKEYPGELVRLALELVTVRQKAAGKFEHGGQLWLTRQSFEQSTSEPVARYKAQRFAKVVGAGEVLYDYCSGLGADAIALAEIAPVVACDLDPVMLELARWNAEIYGVADRIEFRQEDAETVDVSGQVIHLDPDQRDAAGRRHLRLEQIRPDLARMQDMVSSCRAGGIKLSPASNFGGKFPEAEVELVSWGGECKLATIWCGELAEPGLWRATALPSGESIAGDPLAAWPEYGDVSDYLFDPDPAVVRAGLVNALSEQLQIQRLDDADEYLTADRLVDSPFVKPLRVIDTLGRNETQLRKYLRKNNVGTVEIKCRHVPLDVEKLRRSLPLKGERSLVLVYARVAGKTRIVVCERPTEAEL